MSFCRRCGGEVLQKPVARLALVGVAMLAATCLGFLWPTLWPAALIVALIAMYLFAWAAMGRGRWCRTCKRFDGGVVEDADVLQPLVRELERL